MCSNIPSKVWMTAERPGPEYCNGVKSFLEFASKSSGGVDWYLCPCVKCRNVGAGKTSLMVEEHLICNGVLPSYTTWFCHGEPIENINKNFVDHGDTTSSKAQEELPRMFDLINDSLRQFQPEVLDEGVNDIRSHEDIPVNHVHDDLQENATKKLRNDASQPLYPSCSSEHTKLSVIVELVSLKSTHNWSDASFNDLLEKLKRILPSGNTLPESTRESLEMIKALGMNYEMIHVCPNNCILYRKEHESKTKCPKCGLSRYKPDYIDNKKGVPYKVLRYFPLTPRLRRLYSIPWIAKMMTWHSESASRSGYMRHPADSSCWKGLDFEYPEFSAEPRNVRLGLATDGFNPFGNNSLSYSCWPVMVVPYNLPPSFCMLKEFTMLSLLIPGKRSPGSKIDVFLQPLIDELNDLWRIGTTVYDSHNNTEFSMRAALLWTIHDFPAYGYISGCKTAGKYACPICGEDVNSFRLQHGMKQAYMGHRCFLSDDHEFRFQKSQFNGEEEHGKTPRRLSGDEVLEKVEGIQAEYGRSMTRKRKRCEEDITAWSKKSILFELPYWKNLVVRNNLDVMHVEKNVTENLLAAIMKTKKKTKDGRKARLDLKEMGIRRGMWPRVDGSLPIAPFVLSDPEKRIMCETLKMLKVPIGYSSNWFHNVDMEELEIRCPKSHDYHIVIQQLLPVLLMHAYKKQKPLAAAIRQLSLFFNVLCSKVICLKDLDVASSRIVEVLCVFEKYFPPSFFVSMTHLVVHLAEEARICGPVRFRWMYSFERMMRTYKMYVKNKRHPEGCIAERYLIQESILYCMEYMPDGKMGNHLRSRKNFFDDDTECPSEQPIDKKGKMYKLSNLEYEQAQRYVLESCDDVTIWRTKYLSYKQNHTTKRKRQRGHTTSESILDFIPWLRKQLEGEKMSTLKRLVEGASFKATSYKAYQANGYLFCTSKSESSKTTQNSGVTMKALTSFRASAKDKNLVEEEATYYGIIKLILELDYYDFKQTVFYCDWVRIEDKVNGCLVDPETKLTFVNLKKFKSNSKLENEPFILASQASQVFYCKDPTRDDWHVVLDAPKKLTRDIDAYEDPLVFDARVEVDAFASALNGEVEDTSTGNEPEVEQN